MNYPTVRVFIEAGSLLHEHEAVLLNDVDDFAPEPIAENHDGLRARFPLLPAVALLLPQVGDLGVGQCGDLVPEDLLRRRFGREDARDLLAHDAEDLGEVLDGGPHLLPRFVHHHHAVAEQLLERVVVVEEHRVECRALLSRSISDLHSTFNFIQFNGI